MLTAYFDESGPSGTLGFFALAALVAPTDAWPCSTLSGSKS